MKLLRFLLCAFLAIALLGCPRPLTSLVHTPTALTTGSIAADAAASTLSGRIGRSRYTTQATPADVGVGATVSLIDTQTNVTVASSVSDSSGNFVLTGLNPVVGRTYYLEAEKGLPVESGGAPNRAAHPGARLRTIAQYSVQNGWQSISAGSMTIDYGTTALSVILSLRSSQPSPPSASALIGSLALSSSGPDVFTPGSTNITSSEYSLVQGMVSNALSTDNDPLMVITYDTTSQTYYLAQRGINVTSVTPIAGSLGTTVAIVGEGLSNAPIIRFNGTVAPVYAVNSVQTQVNVQVPQGATSGPLTVQVGSLVYNGTNFAVSNWDGHNVFDAQGNMYVAGYNDNAIWKFSPAGVASIVASSSVLNSPRSIALDAWGNLYASSWGSSTIYKVVLSTGAISPYASGGGLSNPWGIAIDVSGNLFVANYSGQNVLKIATGSATPITPTVYATGLSGPSRLAFDLSGYLYVSNWNNGTLSRIAPAGTTAVLAAGMSNPGGVALDSLGNIYVGSEGNSCVYKITSAGQMTSFVQIPSYDDSVAFNPDGTLYVGSYGYPYVARVDNLGRILNYYTPGHLTYAIKSDAANNLYLTSGQGWGTYGQTVTRLNWNAASGSYSPPVPFATNLPNPSALGIAPNGDVYIGDWGGLLYKANPSTGAYTTLMAGLGAVSDITFDPSGNPYVVSWGAGCIYQLNNGTIAKTYSTGRNFCNMIKGPDGAYYIPDYSGNQVLRLVNNTLSVYSNNGGSGFGNPLGLTFDSTGNLYVSGWGSGTIYEVATGSLTVSTYASGFSNPGQLTFDASGDLLVDDSSNKAIRMVATGSLVVSTYASLPNTSRGMVRDPSTGILYAAGYNDNAIYQITPSAGGATGSVNPTFGTVSGTPWSIDRDATTGDLYVACYGSGTVDKVPAAGGASVVTATYGNPAGVIRDNGNTYFCTWNNSAIWKVAPGSSPRIIAQAFVTPGAAVIDSTGRYLYEGDWSMGTVVKMDMVANTYTLAAYSRDWLNGTSAISGMTKDSSGNLYVMNWGGGVYKLDPTQINANNGNGVTFYGGNNGSAGILGGIAFGGNGYLYGTTWSWTYNGCSIIDAIPPGGLANGAASYRVRVWPNFIQF